MCIPDDLEQISEQLEEIVELKTCFKNLALGAKSEERGEALKVLFDVLVAQLMKQQSFVREMANFVFKQFSAELDAESLANLLNIVSTPNERATDMVDSASEEGESGDSEEEEAEISEDSDDI